VRMAVDNGGFDLNYIQFAAIEPPAITSQPSNQSVTAGQTANFSITATGTAPLSYHWQKNAVNISGATGASYAMPATTTADNGALLQVIVSSAAGQVTSSAATLLVSSAAVSFQVNSGGGVAGSFRADTGFSGGNTYATTAAIITTGITNSAPQAVYQSERYGNFTYTIGGLTGGAAYTVRLHFAEIYWNAAGSRVFNVAINGAGVLTNFDIFAAAGGKNRALVKEFTATANSSGQIIATYTTVKDNAKSSGIEVLNVGKTGAAPIAAIDADVAPETFNAPDAQAGVDAYIGRIDLGSVKLYKSFKLPLPSPESGASAKRLRWSIVDPRTMPKGAKIAAGIIAGHPTATGTYVVVVKISGKNADAITSYTLAVIP
jgi:hypothetical protein